jgi:hypothetical protein
MKRIQARVSTLHLIDSLMGLQLKENFSLWKLQFSGAFLFLLSVLFSTAFWKNVTIHFDNDRYTKRYGYNRTSYNIWH